jgi:hypothetical protein
MDDPLSRALDEAPASGARHAPAFVDRHTVHPRGVSEILEAVTAQVLEALALPFFDGEGRHELSPAVKAGIAEVGTVHVSAHHLDPPFRADITLDVRTDLESQTDARYQIRGRCEISRGGEASSPHREFALGVTIAADGLLAIDVAQLRAEMADAIRSLG